MVRGRGKVFVAWVGWVGLLPVVQIGAVVREEEANLVEVVTLLDLLLVDLLETGDFAVVAVQDLLKCAVRDVFLLLTSLEELLKNVLDFLESLLLEVIVGHLLAAADVLVLLNADGSAARNERRLEVVTLPLLRGDVAPAVDTGLDSEPREREGGTCFELGLGLGLGLGRWAQG